MVADVAPSKVRGCSVPATTAGPDPASATVAAATVSGASPYWLEIWARTSRPPTLRGATWRTVASYAY